MYQSLTMLGWRTVVPEELPMEVPQLFDRTLLFVRDKLNYSAAEFAAVFRETESRVASMYPQLRRGGTTPALRIM